jgi:hypothetical protein
MSVEDEPALRILANDTEGRRWEFTLGDGATKSSLQDLIGQNVLKVVALAAGELRLQFGDGTDLSVSPRANVEAWEIRCDGESVLIGAPTGGVSSLSEFLGAVGVEDDRVGQSSGMSPDQWATFLPCHAGRGSTCCLFVLQAR